MPKSCSIEGCDGRSYTKGWCKKHYSRWRRHGDASYERPTHATCTVDGCDKKPRSKYAELCVMHYDRMRRNGNFDPPKPRKTKRKDNGYVVLHRPDHSLADKSGRVAQHRQVLYDKIGEGPHDCFWCGKAVAWGGHSGLHVDHLDEVRDNNDPSNLVPTCPGCNFGRGGHLRRERNAIFLATRRVLENHGDEYAAELSVTRKLLNASGSVPRHVEFRAKNSAGFLVHDR